MLKNFPIMLALCFKLSSPYYAENYAGIIDTSLLIKASAVDIPTVRSLSLLNMMTTNKVKDWMHA